ncbi:ion transporter [Pleurocapsales cyanobacterium LEGE 06147]|nr:ion transporter [Pleurocapsales cyanobacterium LEGE 06147]
MKASEKRTLNREREEILQQLEDWLDLPMLLLAFVWLILFVVELTAGLSPLLQALATLIWGAFILDFALEFFLAPHKIAYFKSNWLTVLALLLPALRIFRLARFVRLLNTARATRGLNLVRIMIRTNRGMRALGASMNRRGFGYVMALTIAISLVGAAGMHAFEKDVPGGLQDYGTALWWTAMLMSTMGSQYWPETPEGRVLCFMLALYAFAVFGYVTAALATFFVGRDADNDEAELAGAKSLKMLRDEIKALRAEIEALSGQNRET